MNLAFSHEPGTAIACLSIPIILHKEGPPGISETDLKCGFKIGGGIDQDYKKSPQVRWQFKIKFDLESIGTPVFNGPITKSRAQSSGILHIVGDP